MTGHIFENGISVVDRNNVPVTVNRLISGKGGQGEIYHVTYKGNDYALIWYCKHEEDTIGGEQYETIKTICGEEKLPEEFIWPLFVVTEKNPAGNVNYLVADTKEGKGKVFGYLMRLIPEGYYEMSDFLRADDDPKAKRFKSYNSLLVAGMNIAASMKKLHLVGLLFVDLNPDGYVINPETGNVLVVNCDSIAVDGRLCSVKGMRCYVAPEIPRSHYKKAPDMRTDYYSLAIVLYRLFFIDHPMEGAAFDKYPLWTEQVEDYLYAINPVFHFNPNNDSNRPTEKYAPNAYLRWVIMPLELRKLFIRAFTEGIENPGKRPTEFEWLSTIGRVRDKLVRIIPGLQETFVNFENIESIPKGCLGMKVENNILAIYPRKVLYESSIFENTNRYLTISAGIVYDQELKKLCMRNLTDRVWRCYSDRDKKLTNVGKGEQYPLEDGVMIEFQHDEPRIVGTVFDPRKG